MPGVYEKSFTVGATGARTDTIAPFSSRGPVNFNGQILRKPDIVAPGNNISNNRLGTNILSSYPPNTYRSMSGCSMAT